MTPIRVLQVVTHMERGGLESTLMNYTATLTGKGCSSIFWYTARSERRLTMKSNPLVESSIVCPGWCLGAKAI